MTEQERRIEHNKQALAMVAAERQKMYGGIIDVELDPACMTGKALLAVTDDVFNKLPKEAQYTPHISSKLQKDGQVAPESIKTPKATISSSSRTVDLNLLLG